MKTVGVSQKVWIPAALQIVAGVVLVLVGLDVEGKTAIGTGLGTFMVGYGAKPAPVENKPPRA
jgi:hypothetical protein